MHVHLVRTSLMAGAVLNGKTATVSMIDDAFMKFVFC